MAVCQCGEKLTNHYFKEGGGALECLGCGMYEERRVVTFKPVLNVLKELIASEAEEDKSMLSDEEIKKRCSGDIPESVHFGGRLPERVFPLRVKPFEDIGNKLIQLTNSRKAQRKQTNE